MWLNIKERCSVSSSQIISYTRVLALTLETTGSAESLGRLEGENECQCQALLLDGGPDHARSGSRRLHVAALRRRNENSNSSDVIENREERRNEKDVTQNISCFPS